MKEIKRLNYFEGQFLQAADFQDEQEYHIQMRQLHNRSLHTLGIGNELTNGLECGLRVKKVSPRSVKVTTGMAIDNMGREIVLLDEKFIELEKYTKLEADKTYYLTISYQDDSSDSTIDNICTKEKTRIIESAHFELLDEIIIDGTKIPLASFKLDDSCNIEEDDDVDDSISYPFRSGYVKITGDTMTGPLKIDMSAYAGNAELNVYNLSFITPECNDKLLIGSDKETIGLKQILGQEKVADPWANLELNGVYAHDYVSIGCDRDPQKDDWVLKVSHSDGAHDLVVDSDGNVGIGTDRPGGKLQVSHAVEAHDLVVDETNGNVGIGTNSPSGKLEISHGAGAHDLVVHSTTGNVGIGTTEPSARLQVSDGAIMPAIGNSPTAGIQFPSDPGGGSGDNAFIRYFVENGETTKLLIGCENDADDKIGFWQFGAERMTIINGNVGIGTSAPTHKLHILASDAVGLFESTGNQAYLRLSTNEGLDNRVEITNRPGGRLSLWTAGAGDVFNILRDGNVGIGISEPKSKLQIIGDSDVTPTEGGFLILGHLEGYNIGIDNNEIMARKNGEISTLHLQREGGDLIINGTNSTGNVGIGTSPSHKLHVAGDYIKVDGVKGEQAYIGGDGSGFPNNLDVQIGSFNPNVKMVHMWNAGGTGFPMTVFAQDFVKSSDIKYKKNIENISHALDKILKLRGVMFERKVKISNRKKTKEIGLIAQEVADSLPEVVFKDKRGNYGISFSSLLPLVIEAIKEQQKNIEELKNKISSIERALKVTHRKNNKSIKVQ